MHTLLNRERTLLVSQFLRYFVSGSMALLVHLFALTALVEWLAIHPVLASGSGFFAAVLTNYTMQHYWVFEADSHHKTYFLRYAVVTLITFALNLFLFWLLFNVIKVWYPVSQVIATAIIFVINFMINRNYTFRN